MLWFVVSFGGLFVYSHTEVDKRCFHIPLASKRKNYSFGMDLQSFFLYTVNSYGYSSKVGNGKNLNLAPNDKSSNTAYPEVLCQ